MTIRGRLFLHEAGVRGHAYDDADPARRLAVEMLVDGRVCDLARADAFAPEAATLGDGCYGFGFRLPDRLSGDGGRVEVRLANSEERVGEPLTLAPLVGIEPDAPAGHVACPGGLRLTGWVGTEAGETALVKVVVERALVAEVAASGWVSVPQGAVRTVRAAFDLHLPLQLADGRVHRATVLDGRGRELAGSPCPVLAFPDGLRTFLADRSDLPVGDPRGALVERLVPQSIPFAWFDRMTEIDAAPAPPGRSSRPVVAVILVGDDVDPSIASLEAQRGAGWVAARVPEAGSAGRFAPADVASFLAGEPEASIAVLALAGTRFRPEALARLAAAVDGPLAVAYPDALSGQGAAHPPLLWPAYDAERQATQGYAALVFAAPAPGVAAAVRAGASSLFALFRALATRGEAADLAPVHVPQVLAELPRLDRALGQALAAAGGATPGTVAVTLDPDAETGLPAVHLRRAGAAASVTLAVIEPGVAPPDLDRIAAGSRRLAAARVLVSHRALPVPPGWRNLVVPGWRNPARLRDAALRGSASSAVLLLDAGVEPADADALEELAGALAADGVAAVSGLVLDAEGIVLAAGAVLGPGFSVAAAFAGEREGAGGYAGALRVARGCGALDAACLMVDRAAARDAGGFDAASFPELFAGADLSLKLRRAGHRLLVTPRARFVHRSPWRAPPEPARQAELAHLRRRWGAELIDDPFYHPALNRDGAPFTALAWPPATRGPRRPGPLSPRTEQR